MSTIKITNDLYEANIPDCCAMRTLKEHEEIMWCWGLQSQIGNGSVTKDQNCGLCEMNTLLSKDQYNAQIKALVTNNR